MLSPILKYGNNRADHWAGKGAEIYQVLEMTMKIVSQVDAETWIIQRRLLKVIQSSSVNSIRRENLPPKPKGRPVDSKLEEYYCV